MKAFVYKKYGSADVLQLREIEKPIPKKNEVLIKIFATTVTIGDTIMRSFKLPTPRWQWPIARLFLGISKPRRTILGMELAGIVESTGKKVTLFKKGDPVFASTFATGFGGYAEYKCLPEKGVIAIKPENLSFEQAAAVPGAAMTALHCLKKGNIQKGQKVLIYGASGAVGTYAIQIARHLQAEVTAVCSTANIQLVKSLGADTVIDYTQDDFSSLSESYDLVFGAVSKITAAQSRKVLKKKGIYINVLRDSGGAEKKEALIELRELIEKGRIKPVIDRIYPFEQIPDGHRYVEKGHKKGNVAITVFNEN